MMSPASAAILRDGLWHRNAGLVQLLGLCPLLAVSNSVVNGLGLGLATLFVLVCTNVVVSLLRGLLISSLRIPVFVLIIATLVTVVELVLQAWFPAMDRRLGIFVPLIVTNCTILARAEAFASRHPPGAALLDGLATGAGFAAVLITLGALRELVGRGTLFAGMDMLLGSAAAAVQITLPLEGLLLAVLPPGAFIGLGLMVAAWRWQQHRRGMQANVQPALSNRPTAE
jgi:Na+-translocating ferredoxin:NAD+ oxidoreductase subunit E